MEFLACACAASGGGAPLTQRSFNNSNSQRSQYGDTATPPRPRRTQPRARDTRGPAWYPGPSLGTPSSKTEPMKQRITGFQLDREAPRVANLECGHWQHMPQCPPCTRRGQSQMLQKRASTEFERISPSTPTQPLFGLYTSAANTVYVPCNLIRPMDFAGALRNLLLRRAQSLYGASCRLLPAGFSIPVASSETWELDGFTWAEPAGTSANIRKFLAFQRAGMARILEPSPAPAASRQARESHGPGAGSMLDACGASRLDELRTRFNNGRGP